MLDPWIIEEIRRREEEEREQRERPVLELPLESPAYPRPTGKPDDAGEERGVVILDFST
jgi:hypothetical protein